MSEHEPTNTDRRKVLEPHCFQRVRRSFDARAGIHIVKIFAGDVYVSKPDAVQGDELIDTILGSCIAVCMRDPAANVAGMNHFLLPVLDPASTQGVTTRYGTIAMERLIQNMLAAGAQRGRIECKVFGGADVIKTGLRVGAVNAEFIRDYLKTEGFALHSEDLGGDLPRRIRYYPRTGKVLLRRLRREDDRSVATSERQYAQTLLDAHLDAEPRQS